MRCIVALMLLYAPFFAMSQSGQTILSSDINAAHASGANFIPVQLFKRIIAPKHIDILQEETLLSADLSAITALYDTKSKAISLDLHTDAGKNYRLEMLSFSPFATNAIVGYVDEQGTHAAVYDKGLHYHGAIAGDEHSFAVMSVFANGDATILFGNEDGNFVIGKLEDGSENYILYNDAGLLQRPYTPCGINELPGNIGKQQQNAGSKTTAENLVCRKVRLYWEGDYQLFLNKGNLAAAQNYLTSLFAQVKTMYYLEKIVVELKGLNVWTTADSYIDTGSAGGLNSFKSAWNAKTDTFNGDLAHLITMDNHQNGGRAYLDVLCNRKNAYAYSEIHGSYKFLPLYSWDVEVITHETGHNLGSHHTHWCGWNQGPGGTCGAIDSCTKLEPTTNCSSCMHLYNNQSSAWKGSVMSYCHLVSSRGIDLVNGFLKEPGDFIRQNVDGATCLLTIDTCFPAGISRMLSNVVHKLRIYPNPGSGSVTFAFEAADNGIAELSITDVCGKVIMLSELNFNAGETRWPINIEGWAKGVYMLLLAEPGKPSEQIKLVVQ